jgi:hypothetical protein
MMGRPFLVEFVNKELDWDYFIWHRVQNIEVKNGSLKFASCFGMLDLNICVNKSRPKKKSKWAQPGFEPGACHIQFLKGESIENAPEATIIPLDHWADFIDREPELLAIEPEALSNSHLNSENLLFYIMRIAN